MHLFASSSSQPSRLQRLEDVLSKQACYETPKGLEARREALKTLNVLVSQWIQSISLNAGMHWQDVHKIRGRIVTYGSYMLGISHQGADIDALCIAPQHVSRSEYFKSFYQLLSFQQEVSELRAIEKAFVPVIKFRYNTIEIDLTFASKYYDYRVSCQGRTSVIFPFTDDVTMHIPLFGCQCNLLFP